MFLLPIVFAAVIPLLIAALFATGFRRSGTWVRPNPW